MLVHQSCLPRYMLFQHVAAWSLPKRSTQSWVQIMSGACRRSLEWISIVKSRVSRTDGRRVEERSNNRVILWNDVLNYLGEQIVLNSDHKTRKKTLTDCQGRRSRKRLVERPWLQLMYHKRSLTCFVMNWIQFQKSLEAELGKQQKMLLSLRSNPQTGSPYIQKSDGLCTRTDHHMLLPIVLHMVVPLCCKQ